MLPATHPSLYEINVRIFLEERARSLGRPATLDDVGDDYLAQLAALGMDVVWLLGVWQTGPAGREVSRTHPGWRREYLALLPDLREEDVAGSPFAVQRYAVHADFGGDEALSRLRERLRRRGLRLLLDFVPNHTALDHAWVEGHPEYYVRGDEADLAHEPFNYRRVATRRGPLVLAHGRDPYFPGWPDTLQLNYRCEALREAMIGELLRVAGLCDGVRCDMAMLLLPDAIDLTWGEKARPADGTPPAGASFWPEAIARVRRAHPGFLFLAEVYWGREWELQQQGFDYTYDKALYDRLHEQNAEAVRGHLGATLDFQTRSARFLENHDEPRAAAAFPPAVHRAAAAVAFLLPGLRFFHEGQFEGRRQRVSVHLGRRPDEPIDEGLRAFYARLLSCANLPAVRGGNWQLLECRPAWGENSTWRNFLAFAWQGALGERILVTANYSASSGQCYVALPWSELPGRTWRLRDRIGPAHYERAGDDLARRGLYLDLPDWGCHVFEVGPG